MARVKDMIRDAMIDPCPEFRLLTHPDKIRLDEDLGLTMADLDLVRATHTQNITAANYLFTNRGGSLFCFQTYRFQKH